MRSKILKILRIFFSAIFSLISGSYIFLNLSSDKTISTGIVIIISLALGVLVGGLIYSFSEINCQERINRRKKAAMAVTTKKE